LLAKAAGACPRERLLAGTVPALVWLAEFAVMVVAFGFGPRYFGPFHVAYMGLTGAVWVLLPTVALLLGTLPFLRDSGIKSASRG